MYIAAKNGQIGIISKLAEHGSTAIDTKYHGRTPMHAAVSKGQLGCTRNGFHSLESFSVVEGDCKLLNGSKVKQKFVT